MQTSDEFTVVSRRIETLTNVLQHMQHRKPPRSSKDNVPLLLRHFATLLTCGGKEEKDGKSAIAVTGSTEAGGKIKTLIAMQNPGPSDQSTRGCLTLKRAEMESRSFDQVVSGDPDPKNLLQHIADLCRALTTCDPDNVGQFAALQEFVIARCYRKLRVRFNQFDKLFNGRFLEIVEEWKAEGEELDQQWVNVPKWLYDLLPEEYSMNEQTSTVQGETVVQWEFSDSNKRIWVILLAKILSPLRDAFNAADEVRNRAMTEKKIGRPVEGEREAYSIIDSWLRRLFVYVQSQQNVISTLLTQTNLEHYLRAQATSQLNRWKEEIEEESADMVREEEESFGEYLLRSLRMIVAWHASLYGLMKRSHDLLRDVDVGVVEFPYHAPNPLKIDDMKKELVMRLPNAPLDVFEKNFPDPEDFHGTVHAEAALMGMLTYFSPGYQGTDHKEDIINQEALRKIFLLSAFEKFIAVEKKCCWCCDRLRYHLDKHLGPEFQLPGTHGVVFAWIPPKTGVSLSVLKALESDLWNELYWALRERIPTPPSPRSPRTNFWIEDDFDEDT
ncbi:hypothetical protein AX15_005453 [Amanita polypyramis BW_CC]|nr:hypothetical protein AX15_005453 [Amanita polypyramis BW_CC]